MSNYILTPNGELYRYGAKGMKWGKRRSQEELDRIAGRKLDRIEKKKKSVTLQTEKRLSKMRAEKDRLNTEIEANKKGITEAGRGKTINKAERTNTQHEIDRLQSKSLSDGFITKWGEQHAKKKVNVMSKRLIELDASDLEHDRKIANFLSDNAIKKTRIEQIDETSTMLGETYVKTIAKLDTKANKIKKKYNQ